VAGASTPDQRILRTSLSGMADAARRARIEGPATLVVGEVVAWSASQQRTAESARAPEAGEARAV
jgi:siroheme synthase